MPLVRKTNSERIQFFLDHISPEPNTGCWIWTGSCTSGKEKRAKYVIPEHKIQLASHAALFLFKGLLRGKLIVKHSCDLPQCVNPEHLSLGTQKENVRESHAKKRSWQSKITHCPRGHAYAEHRMWSQKGGKACRICRNEQQRKYSQEKRDTERAAKIKTSGVRA